MSNKDRPGKTISFYANYVVLAELAEMVKHENRSVSNMLRVLIHRAYMIYNPTGLVDLKEQSNDPS